MASIKEGEIYTTNNYGDLVVIEYVNYYNVRVEFVDTGYKTTATAGNINKGGVRDRMIPSVHGKGINDLKGNSGEGPFYQRWENMLQRCYCLSELEKYPTYKGCSVREEWLLLSNFKNWMETQVYKGLELDKDLLFEGNKLYSATTCIFVTSEVNSFIGNSGAKGYHLRDSGSFQALINIKGSLKGLGTYDTKEQAQDAYHSAMNEKLEDLIARQTNPIVKEKLKRFYK